eukprot:1340900-Prymnesium_polylepis.1
MARVGLPDYIVRALAAHGWRGSRVPRAARCGHVVGGSAAGGAAGAGGGRQRARAEDRSSRMRARTSALGGW